jgi:hypothetical protein
MECRFRVLLRCPECLRIFCVPELAGSSVVYHRECAVPLDRIACVDVAEHADRANVFYFKERDQLEVTNRAEGQ